jgi:hypothetical protein
MFLLPSVSRLSSSASVKRRILILAYLIAPDQICPFNRFVAYRAEHLVTAAGAALSVEPVEVDALIFDFDGWEYHNGDGN